jgi:hypothetical protein
VASEATPHRRSRLSHLPSPHARAADVFSGQTAVWPRALFPYGGKCAAMHFAQRRSLRFLPGASGGQLSKTSQRQPCTSLPATALGQMLRECLRQATRSASRAAAQCCAVERTLLSRCCSRCAAKAGKGMEVPWQFPMAAPFADGRRRHCGRACRVGNVDVPRQDESETLPSDDSWLRSLRSSARSLTSQLGVLPGGVPRQRAAHALLHTLQPRAPCVLTKRPAFECAPL